MDKDKHEAHPIPTTLPDVVLTLTLTGKVLQPQNSGAEPHDHGVGQNVETSTVFYLRSAVLKEQSRYFEAEILRWSDTSTSSQSPVPWRGTLKCIDDVGPAAYTKCFHAMYEAHYGESANVIAQNVVESVAEALELLQVASHLGFSVGVDAALLRIRAVPWTADEAVAVAQCVQLLQVPVPEDLAARMQSAGQSIRSTRRVMRDLIVMCWNESLSEWRRVIKFSELNPRKPGARLPQTAFEILEICNTMFGLFEKAVEFGTAERLIINWTYFTDVFDPLRKDYICDEAYLLLLLRVMQALSKGEVVCDEISRRKMVDSCQSALCYSPCALEYDVQRQTENLKIFSVSCYTRAHHLRAFCARQSWTALFDLQREVALCMGLVMTTLQDQSKATQNLFRWFIEDLTPKSYQNKQALATRMMGVLEPILSSTEPDVERMCSE